MPFTHFYWDIYANTCWSFDEDQIVCGRIEGHFQYEDSELSASHCQFSIQNNKCFLTDLESKNGTYHNQKLIEKEKPQELKCFDVIIFGSQIIIYMDQNIFKLNSREDILQTIDLNIENKNIFNEIKNKTIVFMRNLHPKLVIQKKILTMDAKIAGAYNIQEDKLQKYDQKVQEIKGLADQHLKKVKQLEEKIKHVLAEKEKLSNKIKPQIDSLHKEREQLDSQLESLDEATGV